MTVDAFTVNWADFNLCYAFPPFSLVGKVINKAIRDSADLLLVAPNWKTQYWFPILMEFVVDEPLHLPVTADTIYLTHDKNSIHPIWNKLKLCCFRISGKR